MQRADHDSGGTSIGGQVLNEHQLRHFAVFLELLEKSLDEVERFASLPRRASPGSGDTLVYYEMDLPPDFNECAAAIVASLRVQLLALAKMLHLPPRGYSRSRAIAALVTAEILRVDDSFAEKLHCYGTVAARVKTELDPRLESMRAQLVLLRACLHDPAPVLSGLGQGPGTL